MENQYVAAVDLGTTKVVMAVGRRAEKNKVEIVALREFVSKGVNKGDLRNVEQASISLREVKTRIEDELNISINEVFIGISGQHIKCNRASGYVFVHNSDNPVSEVTAEDVQRLSDEMRNSSVQVGQTIITVLPQTYNVDDEIDVSDPIGMEGKRLEAKFNIIVGEDAAIERIYRCFDRAGLKVEGVILQPLASSDAVLSEDEKELGVAVVDIGGGTTDICIYHDKVIRHIAVLPIGGNIVNDDIRSYGILERHVEKLKTTFGEAIAEKAAEQKYINIPSVSGHAPKEIAVRTLAGIIEARMYDIIDFVAEQIDKVGYKGKLGAGVVLTGGGSLLKNMDVLLRQQLGCEVRLAVPNQHIAPESLEIVTSPKYSTIAGILISAIREGKTSEIIERAPRVVEPAVEAEPQAAAFAGAAAPQVGYVPQSEHQIPAADSYEQDPEDYPEEEQFIEQDRQRKPGFFGKMKVAFGKIFEDSEIDDEENY